MSEQKKHPVRRIGRILGGVVVYLLIWAGLTMLIAALGIQYNWGAITFTQFLMNLSPQAEGGGGDLVWLGILCIGVLPIVVTLGIFLFRFFRARRRNRRVAEGKPVRPRRRGARLISCVLVLALVVGGGWAFSTTVGLPDYVRATFSPYNMADYYKTPQVANSTKKHNLVTIYLEPGEQTLADKHLFEKDAFSSLEKSTQASAGWKKVDSLQQYEGGGWTMAGISSTQCGVPLKGTGSLTGGDETTDNNVNSYLGGLTCAGDVLKANGYKNVFMGGANGSFASKNTFLKSHGYSEEKDLFDWQAAGEPEKNFRSDWGLSDGRLMAHAKEEIDTLHAESEKSGKPFNLSMLTLDTHEPVHIFDYCKVNTKNEVTSVYACSMSQVAGFVDYMKDKGYLKDTSVVIMGDHLKHMSAGDAFHEQLDDNPNRSIFNRVWVPGEDKTTKLRSGVDQLNMYPTLLEAAGLQLKDHEAGLGVSAFTEKIPSGSAQHLGQNEYRQLLDSRSKDFYEKAWSGAK